MARAIYKFAGVGAWLVERNLRGSLKYVFAFKNWQQHCCSGRSDLDVVANIHAKSGAVERMNGDTGAWCQVCK